MQIKINEHETIETSEPLDISMQLQGNKRNVRAWYVDSPAITAVVNDQFIGDVNQGGSVNFRNVFFNPHGHGTHTECLGHISPDWVSVNACLKEFWFRCELISITPKNIWNEKYREMDTVVLAKQIEEKNISSCDALVIRTLPNDRTKKHHYYSGTNPCYFSPEIVPILDKKGIQHLLVDTPSVDRECDEGVLAFHHAFWKYPQQPQFQKSITELIYVDNAIPDGQYILNLQFAPFDNDAAPSRPVLYALK
jgi:kynurenine formamidase